MKKIFLLFALTVIFSVSKAQTSTFKFDVDNEKINLLFKAFYVPTAKEDTARFTIEQKQEFVYKMIMDFVDIKSAEVAGNIAADVAREAEINRLKIKPTEKGK